MSVILQTINKSNGEVFNVNDITKIDSNATITQDTLNNLDINKANIICENPIEPTLINAWVNDENGYGHASYWKDSLGYINLKGAVSNVSQVINTIFILPEGYRPLTNMQFVVGGLSSFSGKSSWWTIINILTDGSVNIGENTSSSKVFLDGIRFKVGV